MSRLNGRPLPKPPDPMLEVGVAVYDRVMKELPERAIKALEPNLGAVFGEVKSLHGELKSVQAEVAALVGSMITKEMSELKVALKDHYDRRFAEQQKAFENQLLERQQQYEKRLAEADHHHWTTLEQFKSILQSLPIPQVIVPESAIMVQQLPSQVIVPESAIRIEQLPSSVVVTNEVKSPEVHVTNDVRTPDVKVVNEVKSPEVHVRNEVPSPKINFAPLVNVPELKQPEVKVESIINIPELKQPEVRIESIVNVPPPRRVRKLFEYDTNGRPLEVREEEQA